MKVLFVDLHRQYLSIKPEMDEAIANVIRDTAFIRGKYVNDFEREFETLNKAPYCISLANGTDAIYIALKMMGIGQGDEVITASNSWISSSETITQAGAKPVFVDVDKYFSIDADEIEQHITERTKAIIPVHLQGHVVDMDKIKALCKKYNLFLIEDTAQAQFSEYNGQYCGTMGDVGTFSFYPGKNLGAYGDAGCAITSNFELAQKMRMYANHGSLVKHQHEIEGINSRLDGLQAAILSVKLKHILKWTELRRQHADYYNEILSEIEEIKLPKVRQNTKHSYHLYVLRAKKRDELTKHLAENGVENFRQYPVILPLLPCYQYLGKTAKDFPTAYKHQQEIISIPIFPEIREEEMNYVRDSIKSFYTNYIHPVSI